MNEMVRNPQWPAQGSMKDPVKQIFDRLFEGNLFQNATDESSVVTSQWVPRVDIKEEADRFLLYADIPGVDPQAIAVAAAIGCSASFLTPLAHPVNILMMSPGNYRFTDFARVGFGLLIVVFLAVMLGMILFWRL